MHEDYLDIITKKGNNEDMECLEDVFNTSMEYLKRYDEEKYNKLETKMYEIAYGKVLTEDMAKEWVSSMQPMPKWTIEETDTILKKYGINIDRICFYVVMNMLYSDMKNVLGNGDDDQSIRTYILATNDWLDDKDAGPDKLYNYHKYIVK